MELGTSWKMHSKPYCHFQGRNRILPVQLAGHRKRHQKEEQRPTCYNLQLVMASVKKVAASNDSRLPSFKPLSCTFNGGYAVSQAETDIFTSWDEEALVLKRKADALIPELKGKCIFLVGMMGSGKTTVGKIISEALGYYFFDSDRLVEEAAGGMSVAQIFQDHNEQCFRDSESEVLKQLSTMYRLVVATGGGAVVRPQNWNYMRQGITVWLDVPVEALAERVVAVGTESRPLLGQASGDRYSEAFSRLSKLYEDRAEAYSNSDVRVSLKKIASKLGYNNVSPLTPTIIAIETLKEISDLRRDRKLMNGAAGA
uniref:shikimate kinase n=1 Tax=Araucaria cunninghamii TaxID=56994 RepID=A0A0D6R3C4_ARACU